MSDPGAPTASTPATAVSPVRATRSRVTLHRLAGRPWWAVPAGAAVAYVVVVALHVRDTLGAIYENADATISPLVGATLASGTGGRTTWMASDTFINAIWFDRVVGQLPGGRLVEEWTPAVLCVAAAAAVAWTVRRVDPRSPWWLGGLLALAAPPAALFGLLPQEFHGSTALNAVLVGAVLSAAATRGIPGVAAVAAGLLTGLDLVSDPLLAVAAVVPAVVAVVATARLRPGAAARHLVRSAMVVGIWAALGAAATVLGTWAEGVSTLPAEGGGSLATPERIWENARLLAGQVARLADGRLFGAEGLGIEGVVAGVLAAAAVTALVAVTLRAERRRDHGRADDPPAGATDAPAGADPLATARLAHILYWTGSLVLVGAAYVASTFATDVSTVRYLTVLPFAVAALAPLAGRPGTRSVPVVAVCAAAWMAASAAGVAIVPAAVYRDGGTSQPRPPRLADLDAVVAVLERQGLRRGYASYWDAGPLTWRSEGRVEVRPVMQGRPCGDPGGGTTCAYHWNTSDAWFVPQAVDRTFVLRHPGAACLDGPPPALGTPLETLRAAGAEILVYRGDVAARFGRSLFALCPPS